MSGDVVGELVGPLRAAVDELLDAALTSFTAADVTALLRELEVERRRLTAVDHQVLAEIDDRGVAGEYARCSTTDLLVNLLRVTPREAKVRVEQARDACPHVLISGAVVPPVLPRCADATRTGEISAAHVAVIAKTTDDISRGAAAEVVPVCEQLLVEAARHQHPGALAQTAAMLLARLDPDGREPDDAEAERRRGFTLTRRANGTARVSGEWTAEATAIWDAILDTLAAPQPAADGGPDDRSAAQRRHDAMIDAGTRLLRSDTLPAAGGTPTTVLLRMTPDDLFGVAERGAHPAGSEAGPRGGMAVTARADVWPAKRVRAAMTDAAVIPIIVDHRGAVLACGRTRRLASTAQRVVLTARDGGCCFPGCARPAAWTEAHHIIAWEDGGPTDIDNLCLLCRYHHRTFASHGWAVAMTDGVPTWTPPAFIDPQRRPVRNTAHHPPDLAFDSPGCLDLDTA